MKSLGVRGDEEEEVVDGDFALPATPGDFGPPPHAASKKLTTTSVTRAGKLPDRCGWRRGLLGVEVFR